MSDLDSSRRPALIREVPAVRPPSLVHAGWVDRFPWLVQGTTTRGSSDSVFDLGLFSGGSPQEEVRVRWGELREATRMSRVVHAHQVHGARVRVHGAGAAELQIVGDCDGHVTAEAGVLLGVTTADCVPVFLVDARRRAVAVVHAGWRGAAAGVLEEGLRAMLDGVRSDAGHVHAHMGPAICGSCYEVGPEVFEALGAPRPEDPTPIDLRAILAGRALEFGVPKAQVTVSEHCTRCTESGLFSHRAGDKARQVGFIGIRP